MPEKQDIIIQTAGDLLGCPYVYGAWGNTCTTRLRKNTPPSGPARPPSPSSAARCSGRRTRKAAATGASTRENWLLTGLVMRNSPETLLLIKTPKMR